MGFFIEIYPDDRNIHEEEEEEEWGWSALEARNKKLCRSRTRRLTEANRGKNQEWPCFRPRSLIFFCGQGFIHSLGDQKVNPSTCVGPGEPESASCKNRLRLKRERGESREVFLLFSSLGST